MKIATWNVNSIKMREASVAQWLQEGNADALVMQETKTVDELFPRTAFERLGYETLCFGQKTYNGVALLARKDRFSDISLIAKNIPGHCDDQARLIAARLTPNEGSAFIFIGAYFPNGQEVGCAKYLYKLDWIGALTLWIRELLQAGNEVILAGDFNIAPEDDDVWDPKSWAGKILVSAPERRAFARLLETGLTDPWKRFEHPADTYSWWDYRFSGFEKNHGLRIDHLLATPQIANSIREMRIDKNVRAADKPSDHAPVIATMGEDSSHSDAMPSTAGDQLAFAF